MTEFILYRHVRLGIEAVKIGFSWPAFCFGPIWMLAKKLWSIAAVFLVLVIPLTLIEVAISGVLEIVLSILVSIVSSLVCGFMGNKWREDNLLTRGYEGMATIQAETPDAAVAKFAETA